MSIKRLKYQEDSAETAINISPLIDVLFILLIFFIVTMVFSNKSALDIESPKASNATTLNENIVAIAIDKSGSYYYDNQQYSLETLEKILLNLKGQKGIAIVLEADANASVQSVVSLINMSKSIGVEEVYVQADKN